MSIGVTQGIFKVDHPDKQAPIHIHVFEKLNYDLILGYNFTSWCNAGSTYIGDNLWSTHRHVKGQFVPLKTTLRVPSQASFDYVFANIFPGIYGPEQSRILSSSTTDQPKETHVKKPKRTRTRKTKSYTAANPEFAMNDIQAIQHWSFKADDDDGKIDKVIKKTKINKRRNEFPEEVDNVIIFGKTFDELIYNRNLVFQEIRRIGLKVQPDKCKWGHKEVKFLGHMISGRSIVSDSAKAERVIVFTPPANVSTLQSQLRLFNYLVKFIPNYSTSASNEFELVSKKKSFRWTEAHRKCWQAIKSLLVKYCELAQFDPQKQHKLIDDGNNKIWDENSTQNIISYNNTPSESLGYSPHYLLVQTPSRSPLTNEYNLDQEPDEGDINTIRKDLHDQRVLNQASTMSKLPDKKPPFNEGDAVRIAVQNIDTKIGKKLTPTFKGVYIVHKILDSTALVTCVNTFKKFKVNFRQLKLIDSDSNEPETIKEPEGQG